jgi:hypothetical protein
MTILSQIDKNTVKMKRSTELEIILECTENVLQSKPTKRLNQRQLHMRTSEALRYITLHCGGVGGGGGV